MIARSMALSLLLLTAVLWPKGAGAAEVEGEARSYVSDQRLQAELADYLSALDGSYGVAVENLSDGRVVLINVVEEFPTASLYKLFVMYRVFQRAEQQTISMSDPITIIDEDTVEAEPDEDILAGTTLTVGDALSAMIDVSSNVAAYALVRVTGGWEELESVPGELGLTHTSLQDDFTTTPWDVMQFLEMLADHKLVSANASDQMLDLLKRQGINDRIPALLPPDAEAAHKTGDLDGVRNDAGIVAGPGGRFIIVTMSDAIPAEADRAEAEMALIVYDRYSD